MAPDGSGGDGNTNSSPPRPNAAKKWVFTAFNTKPDDMIKLIGSNGSRYFFGVEKCPETGREHLQGFVKFAVKCRPLEKIKSTDIHWEVQKASDEDNVNYCKKDGKVFTNMEEHKPVKTLKPEQLYDWQKKIVKIIEKEPDDRTIHWFYEREGNAGKTTFCKYLSIKYGAIPLEGKKNDILFCAATFASNIYVWDLERSMEEFVSYGAIEKIKNGYYMCAKYESKPIIRNPPHIFIFANFKPDVDKLSADRWNINKI